MILEISKSSVVKGVFRTFFRESVILKRYNCTVSNRIFLLVDRQERALKLPKVNCISNINNQLVSKFFSSESPEGAIDRVTFDSVCTETLDSLTDYFEELVESVPHLKNADVQYSDGVLTVHLGKNYGTYVINRQSPNLQIWLSSPTSGPKRYDFINGTWVYKHDKTTLHSLLDKEIKEIVNEQVKFVERCSHAKASI